MKKGSLKRWVAAGVVLSVVVFLLAMGDEGIQKKVDDSIFTMKYGENARMTEEKEETEVKPVIYARGANYVKKHVPDLFLENGRPISELVVGDYTSDMVDFSGEFYDMPQDLLYYLKKNEPEKIDEITKEIENGKEVLYEKVTVKIPTRITTELGRSFSHTFTLTGYNYVRFPSRMESYVGPIDVRLIVFYPEETDKLDIQVCRTPEVYERIKECGIEDMLEAREYIYSDEFNEQADEVAERLVENLFEEQ